MIQTARSPTRHDRKVVSRRISKQGWTEYKDVIRRRARSLAWAAST
jgi:hypothetical protein